MSLFLDSEPFDADQQTLGGAIESASQKLGPTGRIIVEVRIDGEPVSGEDLDRLIDAPVPQTPVHLISADPAELALQTLEELAEELMHARQQQQEAAGLLSTDEAATALEHIRAALGVWQQAQIAVQYIARLMELELDTIEIDGVPLTDLIRDLADKLAAIREQLVAGDWIALSDSFGYELDQTAETWTAMLAGLGRRIREGAAG